MIIQMPESVVKQSEALGGEFFQKALQAETSGDVDLAIELYKKAIATNVRCAGAMVNLGSIHYNLQQYDEAEDYYRSALVADPQYPLAHFNLAIVLDTRGDTQGALRHYLLAVQHSPRYADAHFNLALLYQGKLNDEVKAIMHWRMYIELDPLSPCASSARREMVKLESALRSKKVIPFPLSRGTSA